MDTSLFSVPHSVHTPDVRWGLGYRLLFPTVPLTTRSGSGQFQTGPGTEIARLTYEPCRRQPPSRCLFSVEGFIRGPLRRGRRGSCLSSRSVSLSAQTRRIRRNFRRFTPNGRRRASGLICLSADACKVEGRGPDGEGFRHFRRGQGQKGPTPVLTRQEL